METRYEKKIFEVIDEHNEGIFVLNLELDEVVPHHTHVQGHILVVLEGVAAVDAEHTQFFIPNGFFVWIPSGVSHRISFDSGSIHILNIYYPPQYCTDPFYSKIGAYPIPSLLYHTLEKVQDQTMVYDNADWHHELLVTLNHILPHITSEIAFQLRLPTTNHPLVLKILDAIHQNYSNPLKASQIASEVGLSVRTLNRYLRSELDVSFIEYLRTYRIAMAIKQIVKGEETITNIGYNVGYESLTAFSNAFFKVTGCRPSQFLNIELG